LPNGWTGNDDTRFELPFAMSTEAEDLPDHAHALLGQSKPVLSDEIQRHLGSLLAAAYAHDDAEPSATCRFADLLAKLDVALGQAGIEPSVGSFGDSYDNALAETVIGLFKTEVIHRRGPWRSFEAVEYATLEWVDWFNHRRLLEPIGNVPPAEAEARYYAQAEVQALAA
jgi:putative transposase